MEDNRALFIFSFVLIISFSTYSVCMVTREPLRNLSS